MISAFNPSAVLFSVKSFIAGMLALYIALSMGFANPNWAIITSYVVAQPRAGAVLSKSLYRAVGTAIGAAMSVFVVPPLVNAPELLSLAIALWLGLCVFLAAIDRTSRSYMFVLAGYSTCIIVFPTLIQPESIFTTAVLRVQEITLGIACSGIVHATLRPNSSGKFLRDRLDGALRDAARWTADALSASRPATLDRDRRRLAVAVNEIHDLVTHASYESAQHARQRRLYRALLMQIERVLPLSAAVDDRILELRQAEALPPDITVHLAKVGEWATMAYANSSDQRKEAKRLRERCAELEPLAKPGMTWEDALRLSLLARLSDLVTVYENCLALKNAIIAAPRDDEERRQVQGLLTLEPRAIDRDYVGALAAAASTTIALFSACLLWIASGWEGGAGAVMLTGVFFALYSGFASPALLLKNKFIGVVVRLSLGAVYVLTVIPSIDGFPALAISLAPVLVISGVLLTAPRYSPLAFNLIIGVLSPSIIADHFESDFGAYINNGLASLTGIYFALIMMRLLQPLWLAGAAQRLLRAGWNDIVHGRYLASLRWRNRMGHRLALLTMRSNNIGPLSSQMTADALRDLRIGLSLAELAGLRPTLTTAARCETSSILNEVAHYYRNLLKKTDHSPPTSLLAHIDHAMQVGLDNSAAGVRRATTLALVSLRRNIFPAAVAVLPVPSASK
ncbi:Uncharacterized membrane protein YccC [Arboricoccus pini]|uniref:Uncharacterized membrane protein YccC n=1 Tax=Arboricoccus pini TaxID=1963835 RepID=A0A212R4R1_9PROT|nr:FUSC family protein [Arboricoccus pini]SNB66870.1 Uncharacterized membrane protein YccC [Arboricoccus pini]